jgi:hypothetical protein
MASGRFTATTCSWPGSMNEMSSATPEKVSSMCPVYSVTEVADCYRLEVRRSPLGHDEPVAKVQLVELQEFAVPLMP